VGNATSLLLYYTSPASPTMPPIPDMPALGVPNTEPPVAPTGAGPRSRSRRPNLVDPATSQQCGSITWDREHGFNLEWDSPEDFNKWRENEQRAHGIELRITQTRGSRGNTKQSALFSASRLFVEKAGRVSALRGAAPAM